jgi:hypothetical protein
MESWRVLRERTESSPKKQNAPASPRRGFLQEQVYHTNTYCQEKSLVFAKIFLMLHFQSLPCWLIFKTTWVINFSGRSPPMRSKYGLALYLSPRALAATALTGLSFAGKFPEPQSTQQAAPPQQPIAAEMSKKEARASALLRGLQSQEYEVRSAAEAMPEEKYGYRLARQPTQPARSERHLLNILSATLFV